MSRLQSQSEIHRDCSCATSSLGVDDGENLAACSFPIHFSLSCRETNKSFQKIGGSGWPLYKLTSAGAHCADNDLRLRDAADGEQRHSRQFLMQQFDCPQSHNRVVSRDVHHHDVSFCSLNPPD